MNKNRKQAKKITLITAKLCLALLLLSCFVSGCQTNVDNTTPTAKPAVSSTKKSTRYVQQKPKSFSIFHAFHRRDNDLWGSLRDQFQLKINPEHPRVQEQIRWYTRHSKDLQLALRHAVPYLYYVKEEVTKRGFPAELALVPIIESDYDPFSYSNKGAVGLWQLMPGTGRSLGLKHNWWYDGRRDVYASTNAALEHLAYLNRLFDSNWLLVMAAYDSGEGRVMHAQTAGRGYKETDFWSLHLPHETLDYVPRLLALSEIIRNPDRYNINLPKIADEPYFSQVNVGVQMDLSEVAKLADISLNELYKLNPGFNHWVTDPKGPNKLVLPITKIDHFQQNLSQSMRTPTIKWEKQAVAKAENNNNLLAKTFHTKDVAQTLKANAASEQMSETLAGRTRQKHAPLMVVYQATRKDTLEKLAKKYHVRVADIRFWNNIRHDLPTLAGRSLTIWTRVNVNKLQIAKQTSHHVYKIKHGDSLSSIAHKLHVNVAELKHWNHLKTHKKLKPGVKLVYYSNGSRRV